MHEPHAEHADIEVDSHFHIVGIQRKVVYAVIMRSASGGGLVADSEFDIVHVGISSDRALSNFAAQPAWRQALYRNRGLRFDRSDRRTLKTAIYATVGQIAGVRATTISLSAGRSAYSRALRHGRLVASTTTARFTVAQEAPSRDRG
jgi:hypothetical protein